MTSNVELDHSRAPGSAALGGPVRGDGQGPSRVHRPDWAVLRELWSQAGDRRVDLVETIRFYQELTGVWLPDVRDVQADLPGQFRALGRKGLTQRQLEQVLVQGAKAVTSGREDAVFAWAMSKVWRIYGRGGTPDDPNAGSQRVQQARRAPGRARSHAPWRTAEDEALRRRVEAGLDLESIALAHGRSMDAIRSRAVKKLGLWIADPRVRTGQNSTSTVGFADDCYKSGQSDVTKAKEVTSA